MFFIRFLRILFIAASIVVLFTTGSYSQEEEPLTTVETTGALEPKDIILASINELSNRLDKFKETVSGLK